MKETEVTAELVTPGDVLGHATELKAGKGAYLNDTTIFASLTGTRRILPPLPESLDQVSVFVFHCNDLLTLCLVLMGFICFVTIYIYMQRATVEVTGHKAHGPIPEPGSLVIARVSLQ